MKYTMETPEIVKHKTTNAKVIKYINKHNCKKSLTVQEEVTMIGN